MAEQQLRRRLVAILAADVAGYSRLMGADEAGTHARLRALRADAIEPQSAAHGGRIFKTTGDGFLIEFASAVDAVRCAVDLQRAMEGRDLMLRIGVNLGDVILEGEDLFGDGVNVAARLEGIAQPGQVCISEDVFRQVRGKVEAAFDDLGEQRLKNIAAPVRAYAVRDPSVPAPAGARAGWPARPDTRGDRPSVAVMPFESLSDDPAQGYFVDGVTEDIITELSRVPGLFVIARNTTFTYKGRPAKVNEIARELGVHYVVEGSARKSANRVRVAVQLIDAETEAHIWAQRYDREMADIFDIQDEIARTIAGTLRGRLEFAHAERVVRKPPEDMAAYECVLAAKVLHHRVHPDANTTAIGYVDRAITIDPLFSQAYAWKACLFGQRVALGMAPADVLGDAYDLLLKGLSLDANDIECHRVLCEAHMFRGELDRARMHHDRAFQLNPNDPRIVAQRGELLTWLGQAAEAVEWLELALRLDPFGTAGRAHLLGRALHASRRYGEAVSAYRQVVHPRYEPHADTAACFARLGQRDQAQSEAAETLRLKPDFSVAAYLESLRYARADDRAHHAEGLRLAGLPD
ncbi:MAG: adenylate/guanylate cyclase domain-containing protein [Rhodospirillales bacterium]